MNTKRWTLLAMLLGLLVGCTKEPVRDKTSLESKPAETTKQPLAPVHTGVTILAEGVIQAAQPEFPVGFDTGGKLLAVHVQPGDQLQAGDLVATLDDTALQEAVTRATLQVAQARNNLAQAQQELADLATDLPLQQAEAQQAVTLAQEEIQEAEYQLKSLGVPATEAAITAARSDVTLAAQELERAEKAYAPYRDKPDDNLSKANYGAAWAEAQQVYDAAVRRLNRLIGSTSDLTRSQKEAELAVAQAQLAQAQVRRDKLLSGEPDELARLRVEQAEITLAQSELDLADAREALADARLVAPRPGTVLRVEATPDTLVGGGSPVVTLLDMTEMEFHTTNLSERNVAQISPRQVAVVTLKAFPNQPIEGEVVRIGVQTGEPMGDAATFPVILRLRKTNLNILPGMTGRVEIRPEG